jgi:hypothetical protein
MKTIKLLLLFICIAGNCFAQRESSYYRGDTYSKSDTGRKSERFRITIAGGSGYMFAGTKDAENDLISMGANRQKVKDFYKKYRWGWQGNADIHYLFNPYIGAGLKYALFSSSETLKQVSFGNYNDDGLTMFFGDLGETIYINYAGPSFLYQNFVNRRKTWKTSALISYGYANYRAESAVMEAPLLVTGSAFGSYSEFGIEYCLSRNIAIGFNVSAFYSSFKKLRAKNNQDSQTVELSDKERNNVSRLNASLSFRIYR